MTIFNSVYGGADKTRPAPREPGANTIAYYKFDGNLADSSGNSRNLSLSTGSVSYDTASGGGKYVYFNRNTWTGNCGLGNLNVNDSDGYTISFFWQAKELLSTSTPNIVADICNSGGNPILMRIAGSIAARGDKNGPGYSASIDTWYHVVFIRSGGYNKMYVNGTFINQGDRSESTGSYSITLRLNQVGNTSSSGYSNNNYLGEFIIENKTWTDAEILDYYTKYGYLYGLGN